MNRIEQKNIIQGDKGNFSINEPRIRAISDNFIKRGMSYNRANHEAIELALFLDDSNWIIRESNKYNSHLIIDVCQHNLNISITFLNKNIDKDKHLYDIRIKNCGSISELTYFMDRTKFLNNILPENNPLFYRVNK